MNQINMTHVGTILFYYNIRAGSSIDRDELTNSGQRPAPGQGGLQLGEGVDAGDVEAGLLAAGLRPSAASGLG